MSGKRQQIQYVLALEPLERGETPLGSSQGTEPWVAKPAPESPAVTEQLMEEVCNRENLVRAWKRVRRNQGSAGVDGMTIDDARDYLGEHWPSIRSQLLAGTTNRNRQAGRNPQAGRWGQKARRALRRRPTDPASLAAGSAGAVGPDVFRAQLRLPTGTLRPSGSSPSATIHCCGLQRRR